MLGKDTDRCRRREALISCTWSRHDLDLVMPGETQFLCKASAVYFTAVMAGAAAQLGDIREVLDARRCGEARFSNDVYQLESIVRVFDGDLALAETFFIWQVPNALLRFFLQ